MSSILFKKNYFSILLRIKIFVKTCLYKVSDLYIHSNLYVKNTKIFPSPNEGQKKFLKYIEQSHGQTPQQYIAVFNGVMKIKYPKTLRCTITGLQSLKWLTSKYRDKHFFPHYVILKLYFQLEI